MLWHKISMFFFIRRELIWSTPLQKDLILFIKMQPFIMTDIFLTEFILLQKEFSPDFAEWFHPFLQNTIFENDKTFSWKKYFFMSFCKRNFFRFFIFNDLYCRRKFFCSTPLQKNFFLYMKKQSLIMINIFSKWFPPLFIFKYLFHRRIFFWSIPLQKDK